MTEATLQPDEIRRIDALLDEVLAGRPAIDLQPFLADAAVYAHELPRRLRKLFHDFKLRESSVALCLRNNPFDGAAVGPTPTRSGERGDQSRIGREDVLHLLYGSLLGESFAWASTRDVHFVNQICPCVDDRDRVISTGSNVTFDLHTEDAYHPFSGDYLGLMCIRNHEQAPTLVAGIDDVDLAPHHAAVLFEPRFRIGANVVHQVSPVRETTSVLFGRRDAPYVRLNVNDTKGVDDEAEAALAALVGALKASMRPVVLAPGESVYVDNLRALHGRPPLSPRYDGDDRWLRGIYLTCDLRKSRALRAAPEARVIESRLPAVSEERFVDLPGALDRLGEPPSLRS